MAVLTSVIVVLSFCGIVNAGPVDHRADSKTHNLFKNLQNIGKDTSKILFGQHGATWLGASGGKPPYTVEPNNGPGNTTGWVYSGKQADMGYKDELCDIKQMCGEYPAVIGFDIGSAGGGHNSVARALAKHAYDRGMVVTISNHWNNPLTGTDAWVRNSRGDTLHALKRLLPGGDHNSKFRSMLDKVADTAMSLKGSDGSLIPVIYRPFHENNGAWFWWGQNNIAKNTVEDFKNIWKYTVHYLRDIKGVHNFLYAYSPSGSYRNLHTGSSFVTGYLDTYPGDEYVDIWGVDDYGDISDPKLFNTFPDKLEALVNEAEKRGKIPALTEFGLQNNGLNQHHNYLNDRLLSPIKAKPAARRIAYMLAWANRCSSKGECQLFLPYHGHPAEPNFMTFYKDPITVFSKSMPNMYN